jgi:hypothetical protein
VPVTATVALDDSTRSVGVNVVAETLTLSA